MRALLIAAIRLYRRRLSGRGPLRAVRCTFEQTESCSAYGLRVAREAPTALAALGLIRARLRRCGEAAVYRMEDGLLWGPLHERAPDALHQALCAARERPETRAALLRARGAVARTRGAARDLARCREHVRALPAGGHLVVRNQRGFIRARTRRLHLRALYAASPLLAVLVTSGKVALLGPLLALLAGFALGRAHRREDAHFDRLRAARWFAPDPILAAASPRARPRDSSGELSNRVLSNT